MSRIKSILVVGGTTTRRNSLVRLLADEAWLCAEASNEEEAEEVLRQVRPAVVLVVVEDPDGREAPSPERLRGLPFVDGVPFALLAPVTHSSTATRSVDVALTPDADPRHLLSTLEVLRQSRAA